MDKDDNKSNKDNRGLITMAVSMGTLPVLKGKEAKRVLDKLSSPTIDKDFIKKCNDIANSIKEGTKK